MFRKLLRNFEPSQSKFKKSLNSFEQIKSLSLEHTISFEERTSHQQFLDLSFEEKTLRSVLPTVHDEIIDEQLVYHKNYPGLRDRYSKLINYNINLDAKYLSRALFSLHAYMLLEKPSLLTDENLKKACIVGWCHKLIDASIILDDDIADESDIRYSKPTWFKLPYVGINNAILDAAFLETGAQFLLQNHLLSHPYQVNIQKVICRTYSYTNVAQTLETRKHQMHELELYQDYVKFYFFTEPLVSTALYLANIGDKDAHKASEEICIDIARYLKIEDDVTCVFRPISVTQKVCTDVSLGRASWLAVEAYKRGSPTQKKMMEEHYGKNNKESVMNIYKIFKELRLEEAFYKYKQEFYEKEVLKIKDGLPKSLPPKLFLDLLKFAMSGQFRI